MQIITPPSCGCRKGKHTAQLNKIYKRKYCNYDLSNEYGIGFTTDKNTKFLFDKEDYNKIKDFAWHISSEGYILTRDRDTHKIIKLHQLHLSKINLQCTYLQLYCIIII